MKKFCLALALALAGSFLTFKSPAISLDDIQLWTGSGTNRAALVIEWSSPEVLTNTTVPVPVADKTFVWGFRFNGQSTAEQMFDAVVAADRRLYAIETNDPTYGPYIQSIGYNLSGNGQYGVSDGTNIYSAGDFTNGFLINPNLGFDAAAPLIPGDLYWGGNAGPNWEVWNELGDNGGFLNSPNRGTNEYWTPDDPDFPFSGTHGQWEYAQAGLRFLPLTNGSWIGYSVAAGGDNYTNDTDPGTVAFNLHKHAPPSPDGTYAAYVYNSNDFGVQIVSATNVSTGSPYNDPTAMLGRPTLTFKITSTAADRVKIVEAPFNVATNGATLITKINNGGEVTVDMGRKIYDSPGNPYGVDFIVYGNSFFDNLSSGSGFISDASDLDTVSLKSSATAGHAAVISVSQDGTNWYTYNPTPVIFPDNSYRWDDTNASWTFEQMNPTKPLNPVIYTNNFGGQSVAGVLDQFIGAMGGTGYDLKASGFSWVQYIRVQTSASDYAVIDAIAAVDPVVVGDALSITPDNLGSGITNLAFQEPDNSSNTLISLNFDSVSAPARISTVNLSEFSAFAPVFGDLSSAYQITAQPVTGTNAVTYSADVGLRAADGYTGNGSDLRVYQWQGANWASQPFTFNATANEVVLAGVTDFSAFVVSQIIPPQLSIQAGANACAFQFTPVPNCLHTLYRTVDFVTWTPVATMTPTNSQPVSLQDNAPPAGKAFYRLGVTIP